MKFRFTVTFLAGLLMVVLLGAVIAVSLYERKTCAVFEANVQSQASLSAIRRLQVATHAMLRTRQELSKTAEAWQQARDAFWPEIQALQKAAGEGKAGAVMMNRLNDAWRRLDRMHGGVADSLERLKQSGMEERIGMQGLALAYERLLRDPSIAGEEVSVVGSILLRLDDYDQQVGEIEGELNALAAWHREEGARRSVVAQRAGGLVLGAALLTAVVLLVRITRMHRTVVKDNAARKKAELAVRASEESLRGTLDSISDAVIATDTNAKVLRMNPVAERLTGWTREESVGLALDDIFKIAEPTFAGDEALNPVVQVIATGQAMEMVGHSILLQRDGAVRPIQVSASPMRDSSGDVVGAVVVFRDVSNQHRLEEQVRLSQKMESVGKLAGGLAHDFNNILQVIKANVSFAMEDLAKVGDVPSCLQAIDRASTTAAELTRQLLAFGRQQQLKMEEVEPGALVKNVLSLIQRIIGEQVEVQLRPCAKLDHLRCDPTQLEQVVINLCINARDAMPEGGRLTLELQNTYLSKERLAGVSWAKPGRFVELMVRDSGVGMDKETLARIFEPFFTTKPAGVGTGLGLAVVQGIVQQHNGVIQVESAPGCGTTFYIFLPSFSPSLQLERQVGAGGAQDAQGSFAAKAGEVVLLAEDDPQVRAVAQSILSREGYRVLACADGEAACKLAAEHLEELSILVFDVVMPHLRGPEAARRILGLRDDLPVVLCTGYAGGHSVIKEAASQGWVIVNKPYVPEALLRVVRQKIDQRAARASAG